MPSLTLHPTTPSKSRPDKISSSSPTTSPPTISLYKTSFATKPPQNNADANKQMPLNMGSLSSLIWTLENKKREDREGYEREYEGWLEGLGGRVYETAIQRVLKPSVGLGGVWDENGEGEEGEEGEGASIDQRTKPFQRRITY